MDIFDVMICLCIMLLN